MFKKKSEDKNDAKKVFKDKGACSHTFFYILNREFGHFHPEEEQGTDILAGGIMQQGHQCGMLWGASMSVGAEAYRRCEDNGQATALAIKATRHVMESFAKRSNTVNCVDITHTDFSKKLQFAKFMLFKARSCFAMAQGWAPEAIEAAKKGLEEEKNGLPEDTLSCASEVVRRLGGTEEQAVMAAGWAGGIGLGGNACGALAAAVWYKTMDWTSKNGTKNAFKNPVAEQAQEAFLKASDYEVDCSEICGRRFNSVEEHTEYIRNGGCERILEVLGE